MDEMNYVLYARAFGWTPVQVDSLPLSLEPYILPIDATIEADISRRKQEAQAAADYKAKHQKR